MKFVELFRGIDDFTMKSMMGGSIETSSLEKGLTSIANAVVDAISVSVGFGMTFDSFQRYVAANKRNQDMTSYSMMDVYRSFTHFDDCWYSTLTAEQWGEIKVWVSSIAASHTKYSKAIYNVYRKECAGRVEDEYVELVSTVLTLQTLLFSMDKAFRRRTNRGNRYIADIKNALSALVQGRDESVLEAIDITEVTRIMNELRASILAAIRAEMPEYLPSLLC